MTAVYVYNEHLQNMWPFYIGMGLCFAGLMVFFYYLFKGPTRK